jgi:flagellar motor protein MotB
VLKMIAFLCLFLVLYSPNQISSQQPPPMAPPRVGAPEPDESGPGIPSRIQKDMEKKANEERQTELKRDTEKLLRLSTELKDYVDRSNENILSVDVIKKADEIEKLAHSVKTRMRGNN